VVRQGAEVGRPAVLLSQTFWQRQFAADPAIVGQAIALNKQPVTVVGVLLSTFDLGSVFAPGMKMDVYVPAKMNVLRNWGNTLSLIGRLRSGVTVAQAQAEANILFPQLIAAHPDWWDGYSATITELKDHVSGKLRRSPFLAGRGPGGAPLAGEWRRYQGHWDDLRCSSDQPGGILGS
jgi:hypothetical protein